jgi:hypothetical protein
MRLDRAALEAEIGAAVVARFSYQTDTDWRFDVRARKGA